MPNMHDHVQPVDVEIVEGHLGGENSPETADKAHINKGLILPSLPMPLSGASELQAAMRTIVQGAISSVPEIASGRLCAQVSYALVPVVQLTLKKI